MEGSKNIKEVFNILKENEEIHNLKEEENTLSSSKEIADNAKKRNEISNNENLEKTKMKIEIKKNEKNQQAYEYLVKFMQDLKCPEIINYLNNYLPKTKEAEFNYSFFEFLKRKRRNFININYIIDEENKTNKNHELKNPKDLNSSIINFNESAKKRGRKKKKLSNKVHSAYDYDNILRKIQVHFLTFVIYFCNDIIDTFFEKNKISLHFKSISYASKKNVSKKIMNSFIKEKISFILQLDVSTKNKTFESFTNRVIYEKLIKLEPFFINLFNTSALEFFNKYYYKKEKSFDINGLHVNLSKRTLVFNDLLISNKNMSRRLCEIAKEFYVNNYKKKIFKVEK